VLLVGNDIPLDALLADLEDRQY